MEFQSVTAVVKSGEGVVKYSSCGWTKNKEWRGFKNNMCDTSQLV